jgi:hypothetical protein
MKNEYNYFQISLNLATDQELIRWLLEDKLLSQSGSKAARKKLYRLLNKEKAEKAVKTKKEK